MKAAHQPLSMLILSAKGWGTGSALRAFYIAEAFKKRGHHVRFIKPLPTLPFWADMALSLPYYFWKSLFTRHQVVLAVKPYPTVVPAMWWQKMLGAKLIFDVDDLDEACAELVSKHIPVDGPLELTDVGVRVANLRDPDGVAIVLRQVVSGGSQGRILPFSKQGADR